MEAVAARQRSQFARIQRQLPTLNAPPAHIPVGYVAPGRDSTAINHAIDGDGSSICGEIEASRLIVMGGVSWHDVPAVAACPHCSFLVSPGHAGES